MEVAIAIIFIFIFAGLCIFFVNSCEKEAKKETDDDMEKEQTYSQSEFLDDFHTLCRQLIKDYECEQCVDSNFYKKLIMSKINLGNISNYKELNLEKECHSALLNASYVVLTTEMNKIKSKAISPLDCVRSIKNIHIACANWLEKNNHLSKEDYYAYYKNI